MGQSFKNLVRRADDVFRAYMRLKWGGPDVFCTCCTCGKDFKMAWIDVGHVVPRGTSYATRWLEENTLPQCVFCNRNDAGAGIEDKVQPEVLEKLQQLARQPFKDDIEFVNATINKYESLLY